MYQKRCNGFYHEVKKGDSLYTISREHNVQLESVMLANPDVDVYNLQIGSKICVPMRCGMKPIYTKMPAYDSNMIMDQTVDTSIGANIGTNIDANMGSVIDADMGTDTGSDIGMNIDTDIGMDTDTDTDTDMFMDDTFAYIVRDGDSMQHLINKFNTSPEEMCRYNSMDNILFKPGITIILPNK